MTDHTRCSVCGAQVKEETTTYTQEIAGHLAVVSDVPVLACPQCGEQYFTPETVDSLQQLIARGEASGQAPKTIEVPVYPFSHARR
jgi:YgiT-type zinc finger domain-containing protein